MAATANVYECMIIFDSNKYNADPTAVVNEVLAILEKAQVEVVIHRPWEERRLAYPVDGHKKGTYYIFYLRGFGPNLASLTSEFNLNDKIVRSMTLKVDPKLVDQTLRNANEDQLVQAVPPSMDDPIAGTKM